MAIQEHIFLYLFTFHFNLTLRQTLKDQIVSFSGVDIDLVEQTDSEIDHDDASSESSDTGMSEDEIVEYKDDTKGDPDWDPVCCSDVADKPATPKTTDEDPDFDDDNVDRGMTDDSSDSDGAIEEDMKADELDLVKCQSCDFRCRTQAPLRNHVMKEHYDEACHQQQMEL